MFRLRFKDIFDMSSTSLAGSYTLSQIVINVLMATICGLIIYFVYRKTYSGVLFSKNLGVTMVIVTLVTSLIVMAIHGNLALSLGMIGALSIVRFRTPIKDPKDLAFLFWSVTAGVICGISAYKLALVGVFFVGLCLYVLSVKLGIASSYLLIVKIKSFGLKEVAQLLKRYCKKTSERSTTVTAENLEVVYEVRLGKITSTELLAHIKAISGLEKAIMVSYEGDLDQPR